MSDYTWTQKTNFVLEETMLEKARRRITELNLTLAGVERERKELAALQEFVAAMETK